MAEICHYGKRVVDRGGLQQFRQFNHLPMANRPLSLTEACGVPSELANLPPLPKEGI